MLTFVSIKVTVFVCYSELLFRLFMCLCVLCVLVRYPRAPPRPALPLGRCSLPPPALSPPPHLLTPPLSGLSLRPPALSRHPPTSSASVAYPQCLTVESYCASIPLRSRPALHATHLLPHSPSWIPSARVTRTV